jgi:hypothetical protein
VDELACHISSFKNKRLSFNHKIEKESEFVSLIVVATIEGILYYSTKMGFYTKSEFIEASK